MPPPGKARGSSRSTQSEELVRQTAERIAGGYAFGPEQLCDWAREALKEVSPPLRGKVLRHLVAVGNTPPTREVLEAVVVEASQGVKGPHRLEFARAALTLAATVPESELDVGTSWVLEALVPVEASGGKQPFFQYPVLIEVFTPPADTPPLLRRALDATAARGQLTREFLDRWADLLRPSLGREAGQGEPAPDLAAAYLGALGRAAPDEMPDALLFLIPRLAALAPAAVVGEFAATRAGKVVFEWFPLRGQATPVGAADARVRFLGAVESAVDALIMEAVGPKTVASPAAEPQKPQQPSEELDRLHDEVKGLSERVAGIAAERDATTRELAATVEDRDRLLETIRQLEQDAQLAREQIRVLTNDGANLRQRIEETEGKAAEWRAEADRREAEVSGQARVQQDRERQELRKAISPLVRDLADHVRTLLEQRRGDDLCRRVGRSFDSLQKHLGRFAGDTDSARLPRDLLARPDSEGADGQPR